MDVDVFPVREGDVKVEDEAVNFCVKKEFQCTEDVKEEFECTEDIKEDPEYNEDDEETEYNEGEGETEFNEDDEEDTEYEEDDEVLYSGSTSDKDEPLDKPTLEMKTKFSDTLNKMLHQKAGNGKIFTKDKYHTILENVKQAKAKRNRSVIDCRLLKRYDIIEINGKEKLIVPVNENTNCIIYYIHAEELFDVLHKTHTRCGHGDLAKMEEELRKIYKNVTKDAISLYFRLCQPCQAKQYNPKTYSVFKPSKLYSKCQVDLIDMETNPDGEYKFILNYQDNFTKFMLLQPLKSKRTEEIANRLVDIFTIFGAPCVLGSDKGIEFVKEVINEVNKVWPELKLLQGNPSQDSDKPNVQNMITKWMRSNNTTRWAEGLRFVQLAKNRTFHQGILMSPYEALFACKAKVGLSTTNLSKKVIDIITTEEHLKNAIAQLQNGKNSRTESVPSDKRKSPTGEAERFCSVCRKERGKNETKYQVDGSITCSLCYNRMLIVKNFPQKQHKLMRKSGKVSEERKYCKVCYDVNVTEYGRAAARKKTKRVVTYCNSCDGNPFLCLPCFNTIH